MTIRSNGGIKNGSMSMPGTNSCTESKSPRIHQNEAVLYPCAAAPTGIHPDNIQDSRLMWATLTPRGTTRHYLEEHTYETIGAGGGGSVLGSYSTTGGYNHSQLKRTANTASSAIAATAYSAASPVEHVSYSQINHKM